MGNEAVSFKRCVSLTYPDGVVGIAVPRWGNTLIPVYTDPATQTPYSAP